MYRRNARKDYLNFARSRKKTLKKIRNAIKKQLSYIKRDLDYIRCLADYGYEADDKQKALIEVIEKVCEQQKYMYDNRTHTVPHRIVSISHRLSALSSAEKLQQMSSSEQSWI
jgi:NADH:ubiquinone oxidoreductase subunit E